MALNLTLFASVAPAAAQIASSSQRTDTLRLTLNDARTLAVRANPELQAAKYEIPAARGRLSQARVLLPNPSFDVLARGEGAELGLTQELEIAGQRGARRAAASAGVRRAEANVTDVARLTLADVDRAFYRLIASDRRAALAQEVLTLNQRLAGFAEQQLAAGGISRFEFNLAQVEFGRSRAKALGASREFESAGTELRQLLGLSPSTPIISVGEEPLVLTATPGPVQLRDSARTSGVRSRLNLDSLTSLAFSLRPDLKERNAALNEATAETSLARREALPNLAARASSEQVGDNRELRPGIGITLPFFNRNRGTIRERRAAAARASAERDATIQRIRSEVARAVRDYELSQSEVDVLENSVLANARENRRLLEIAYKEGKVGLPVLLLIRNQVIDAELEFWEAWLARGEAAAALAAATGENIIGVDLTQNAKK